MLRIRVPDSGTITIGGTDVRDVSLASLRRNFAVVSQPVFLWNRSVAYNICYPLPVRGNEAAVVSASKQAGLHGVVQGLRRGYDTVLGEDGHTLSGGERQRVALARLFLRPAPVMLIDEVPGPSTPSPSRSFSGLCVSCRVAGRRSSSRTGWRP